MYQSLDFELEDSGSRTETGRSTTNESFKNINKKNLETILYIVVGTNQLPLMYLHKIKDSYVLSIKIQPDATVYRYLFTVKSLYMFRMSQHPSSGVLKTVTVASGTGHIVKHKD